MLMSMRLYKQASDESKVFYYKMKGDYYRYLAEFLQTDDRSKAGGSAPCHFPALSLVHPLSAAATCHPLTPPSVSSCLACTLRGTTTGTWQSSCRLTTAPRRVAAPAGPFLHLLIACLFFARLLACSLARLLACSLARLLACSLACLHWALVHWCTGPPL